jgi:hypothetical protein
MERGHDSSVGIATDYWVDGRGIGFYSRQGEEISSFSTAYKLALRPNQWVSRVPSPGIKRPGSEGNHTRPSSAEVKNGGAIPPLPHYVFMASCLIKYTHE